MTDRVELLEAERDFCLRSLRDLDAERDAGDIDARDYESLRDVYTARAAAALRALENGGAPADPPGGAAIAGRAPDNGAGGAVVAGEPSGEPEAASPVEERSTVAGTSATAGRPRWGWKRRALVVAAAAAVAAGASWAVVASSATRLPGQEITGQALGPQAIAQALVQAQQAAGKGDVVGALKDYQTILKRDPSQPEALTGEGWLLAETGEPSLLGQGIGLLASAEKAAPAYAPAHVYRGIALLGEDDYADAIPELQWYLDHNPDPQLAPKVRQALQQAQSKVAQPTGG